MSISLCSTTVANTGIIDCDVSPGIPEKFGIWGGTMNEDDYADSPTAQAFLEDASKAAKADGNKLFIFPVIQDIADKTEANKEGTLNQGFKTVLLEGKPAYEYKVFAGASTMQNLRKFNNQLVRTLTFDANKRAWGVRSSTDFIGATAKIFVQGLKFATGQNVEEGVVTISVSYLNARELNDDAAFVELDSISGIVGLFDVQLSEYDTHASNVYKIQALIPTAEMGVSINLYDQYKTELADDALWTAFTGATYGVPLTITSVAGNDSNGGWDITFDATEFGALSSGDKIKINLAAPDVLDAADVTGVEGLAIIVEV